MRTRRSATRTLSMILLLLLMLTLGCAPTVAEEPAGASAAPEEPERAPQASDIETVRMYTISDYSPPKEFQDRMTQAINELLAKKGLPLRLEMLMERNGVYGLLEQDVDLFFVWDFNWLFNLQWQGRIADLTEYLPNYEELYQVNPQEVWVSSRIGGRDYAFPLVRSMLYNGVHESGVSINYGVLDALGIDAPTSPEELLSAAVLAKDSGLDYQIAYFMREPPYALHRTYAQWPFFVDRENLFVYTPQGDVNLYCESEIFMNDQNMLRSFYDAGVLRLLQDFDQFNAFTGSWDGAFASLYSLYANRDIAEQKDIRTIQFAPEKETYRIEQISSEYVAVSSDANVDAALSLLQALYADQEVYDVFSHGIEGVDWELNADGTYQSELDYSNENLLTHYARRRRNALYTTTPVTEPVNPFGFFAPQFNFVPESQTWSKVFNSTGYSGAYSIQTIRSGFAVESGIPGMIKSLKDAGIEQLLEQSRVQYADFVEEFGR